MQDTSKLDIPEISVIFSHDFFFFSLHALNLGTSKGKEGQADHAATRIAPPRLT